MIDEVAQVPWRARPALAGQHSVSTVPVGEVPGVTLSEHTPGLVLHVSARRGRSADVRRAIGTVIGCEIPDEARWTPGKAGAVVWSGPGQWLVIADAMSGIARPMTAALDGSAAIIDQSSSRLMVRLSGCEVRRCLAKVIGLDLHPAIFAVGHAALTDLAHVPVHLWRLPDAEGHAVYILAAPRSYGGSVWHALVAAAAEYGVDARPLELPR